MTDRSPEVAQCLSITALERAARETAHLDHCPRCRARVAAIRRDNRLLLALVQAGAFEVPTPDPTAGGLDRG